MVAHHPAVVVVVYIARVLIHDVLHGVVLVEHEHQCDDGQFAARTGCQVANAAVGIRLDDSHELFCAATLHGLACQGIHPVGIVVGRVVGEVAAHDKQVLVGEERLQRTGHALKLLVVVGRDDDRHDGRHLLESALQERQLHLQTVLLIVCLAAVGKHAVGCNQPGGRGAVHLNIAQWRGIVVDGIVDRSPVEPSVVTRAEHEDALVVLLRVERHVSRSRHVAAEVWTGMRHDERRHTVEWRPLMKTQETVNLLTESQRVGLIEASRLRGRSYHRLCFGFVAR